MASFGLLRYIRCQNRMVTNKDKQFMDRQQQLEDLRKEVMEKAAAHLKAVTALPDEGIPEKHLLEEAKTTREQWQEAMARMNALLAEMLKEK
jgi:phospholipase/lecithinase/hemolysin